MPGDKTQSEIKRLRKIRENLKGKRPSFRRIESWRYKRVKERWRKARGIDSKTRKKKGGWPISPMIGFRSPKKVRYQSSSGKEEILIFSPVDLSLIDSDRQVGRIAAKIGRKKREQIITEAELLNIRILNPISAKIDLGDLEEELELDDELLDEIDIDDLELSEDEEFGEEE
ncbi:MAG: 50S ribosomal protein L32e [Candidatus Heimdallarchaeota archaeon]|nr:MAG: 50S ribosomal protein L32e [Candidatus Heimdallarchaeota archaeon]